MWGCDWYLARILQWFSGQGSFLEAKETWTGVVWISTDFKKRFPILKMQWFWWWRASILSFGVFIQDIRRKSQPKMRKHSGEHKIWWNKVEWNSWAHFEKWISLTTQNVLRSCTPPWTEGCFEDVWSIVRRETLYYISRTRDFQLVETRLRLEDIETAGNDLCTNRKDWFPLSAPNKRISQMQTGVQ